MPKDKTKSLFGTLSEDATHTSGRIIRVALDTGADSVFDYVLSDYLGAVQPGQRVEVPFG